MPRNRPRRSNSLSKPISRRVSSSGKSSTRITRSRQSARKASGRRSKAVRARSSISASEGACSEDQSVMARGSEEFQLHQEPEAQDDDADERQGASDAPPPELDRVRLAPRSGRVAGREMVAHAPQGRRSERLALPVHPVERAA